MGPKFRPIKLSGRCVARYQWVSPGVSISPSPQIGHDLNRQLSLHRSVEMTDRGPLLVLGGRGQIAQTGPYLYVDDIGIFCDHVTQMHMVLNESRQDFEKSRLMLHQISVSSGSGRALGFELIVEADPSHCGTFWSHP